MTAFAGQSHKHSASVGRLIQAPIRVVFDAWLDSARFKDWMSPRPEAVVTEAAAEPVTGGRLLVVMHAHGRDERHEGQYLAIDRPNRLRFTWSSSAAGTDSVVDITLLVTGDDHTMILLKHEQLRTHASRENHREGWRRILDNLAKMLEHA
jgi:uncharacterized protein YndB with AHSA1/START domain